MEDDRRPVVWGPDDDEEDEEDSYSSLDILLVEVDDNFQGWWGHNCSGVFLISLSLFVFIRVLVGFLVDIRGKLTLIICGIY